MQNLQQKRMLQALEIAKYYPVNYCDQYGKPHQTKATRSAVDIRRVFSKYSYTNTALETRLKSVTGIYCDIQSINRITDTLELPPNQQVIIAFKDVRILLFKHPDYYIPDNVQLTKGVFLIKDGTLIPCPGSKLVGDYSRYYDVTMTGDISAVPIFPQVITDEFEVVHV